MQHLRNGISTLNSPAALCARPRARARRIIGRGGAASESLLNERERTTMMLPATSMLALSAAAASEGPCDILEKAGNPCVAAHSTTRALFSKYDGPLYNVSRPDGTWKSIGLLSAGGFANKPEHDAFCSKGDCVISNVYDQSPQHNHLGQRHGLVNASKHSVTIGKDKTPVYGQTVSCLNFFHPLPLYPLSSFLLSPFPPFPRYPSSHHPVSIGGTRHVVRSRIRLPRRQHDRYRYGKRPRVHL